MNNLKSTVLLNQMKNETHKNLNLCGCVAGDTLILMEDGSEKEIQNIHIGDRVSNEQFCTITVINAITGMEETIYRMILVNGHILKTTANHPVLTEDGLKPMKKLNVGDIVKTSNGDQAIESIEEEEFNNMVYTLELDGESHLMICNSIIAGDFSAENRMMPEEIYDIN